MKRIIILGLVAALLIPGCGQTDSDKVVMTVSEYEALKAQAEKASESEESAPETAEKSEAEEVPTEAPEPPKTTNTSDAEVTVKTKDAVDVFETDSLKISLIKNTGMFCLENKTDSELAVNFVWDGGKLVLNGNQLNPWDMDGANLPPHSEFMTYPKLAMNMVTMGGKELNEDEYIIDGANNFFAQFRYGTPFSEGGSTVPTGQGESGNFTIDIDRTIVELWKQ